MLAVHSSGAYKQYCAEQHLGPLHTGQQVADACNHSTAHPQQAKPVLTSSADRQNQTYSPDRSIMLPSDLAEIWQLLAQWYKSWRLTRDGQEQFARDQLDRGEQNRHHRVRRPVLGAQDTNPSSSSHENNYAQ